VTTSGTVTEYPLSTPNSTPAGITGGPDGAVWFTEFSADKIGRIALAPTSKDQCKHGRWRNFPQFKNQGECVSFVATGDENPPG
jgi:hypothetical protein